MSILTDELSVINAGLPLIVEGVPAAQVTQLDWRPRHSATPMWLASR